MKTYSNIFKDAEIDDIGCGVNITTKKGVMFTADKGIREWGLAPDDNWIATEEAADALGIPIDDFWDVCEPNLNKIMRWQK